MTPLYEPSLGDPCYEPSLGDPCYEPSLRDPVYEPSLGDPVYEPSLGDPVYEPSLDDPVYEPSLGDPVYEPSLGDPVYEPSLGDPVYEPSLGDLVCFRELEGKQDMELQLRNTDMEMRTLRSKVKQVRSTECSKVKHEASEVNSNRGCPAHKSKSLYQPDWSLTLTLLYESNKGMTVAGDWCRAVWTVVICSSEKPITF